jgi:inosine triphosphate pyrophosphatase
MIDSASITVVTGNKHKLSEFVRLMPSLITFTHHDIDIIEIQSADLEAIVRDKARKAYAVIGGPVIVEDVAAGLDKLDGLPGPFIKFFEEKLGRTALYKLGGDEAAATVTCSICFYDGIQEIIVQGIVHGSVVEPRTAVGFGFDIVFKPDGSRKTFAEMKPEEKDKISHRGIAIAKLAQALTQLSKQSS